MNKQKCCQWSDRLWDLWCIVSIIGIWPRFIEPNLLMTTHVNLSLPTLPPDMEGLKILQFSDLHWNRGCSSCSIDRLNKRIEDLKPDLIAFTGDFLCRSQLFDKDRLRLFLVNLRAPLGIYAVLGNHDYVAFLTVNERGEYDVERPSNRSNIFKGFKRLFLPRIKLSKTFSDAAKSVEMHPELINLLKSTSITLLHNSTVKIKVKNSLLNITGLAEYMSGQCNPIEAFKDYDENYPGIVLAHNPDTISYIDKYPGDIVLSGHTHGGQVNLPWMVQKFTLLENPTLKKGLKKIKNKWLYVNRGLSGIMKFRWFSPPELTLITLHATESKTSNKS